MRKRKKFRFLLAFILLTITSLLILLFMLSDKNLRKIIIDMSDNKVGIIMSDCANVAVNRAVQDRGYKYDDIVRVTRNAENNVTSVQIDTIALNLIKTEIDDYFSEEMNKQPQIEIAVPIGTIIGNEYTLGRGPAVKIRLEVSVNTSTDYESKFYSAGINQTLHQLCISVEGEAYLMSPWFKNSTEFKTSYIIAETVITGVVPETVADLNLKKIGD